MQRARRELRVALASSDRELAGPARARARAGLQDGLMTNGPHRSRLLGAALLALLTVTFWPLAADAADAEPAKPDDAWHLGAHGEVDLGILVFLKRAAS